MPSTPVTRLPASIRWKGPVLALAFSALVAAALWLHWRTSRELRELQGRERQTARALSIAPKLAQDLAAIYAPRTDGSRAQRFDEARAEATGHLAELQSVLSDPISGARLAAFEQAVERLTGEIDRDIAETAAGSVERVRATERSKLIEERYREALNTFGDMMRSVSTSLDVMVLTRRAAEDRADGIEIMVIGAFLAVIGAATLVLWRLTQSARGTTESRDKLIGELRASEAMYRSIFDNAIEGIFQTTPDGRFITANKALARMYGFKSPKALIAGLTDIGTQLYVDHSQRAALLEALREEDVVSNFEFEVTRADGRTIWLRENVRAVRDEGGAIRYLEGTVEDISDRWWSEQRRRLQLATARALSESATLAAARPRILESICEVAHWDLGAVWDVDEADGVLRCEEIWHTPDVDVAAFERANSNTTYPIGHGLAGDVWKTGEPRWIASLAKEAGFPNAAIAIKAGMGSAYGLPIKVRGVVRHVLEFFSPKIALPDPELLETLSVISAQLGHLIERKAAEDALRQSEMRKAAILQSALDCIISYDAEGRITEFNPAAERAFLQAQEQVLGRSIESILLPLPAREKGRVALGLDGTAGASGGRRFELIVMRGDASEFPAEVALSRVVISGRPMFTVYLRDITGRREAQRLTSELAAVVANSNDAIIGCTLDGAVRSWNAGAERIFGYAAEELVDRPLEMIFPPERLDEFPQALTAVQRGESLANYETVRLRKDGRKINVSVTDSPIRGEGGAITGVSSIVRDITERRRLEEELRQAQKMEAVGRLAGGIAHDFNNVLTAILGYSDLLLGEIEQRHWMWKHLNEIRKAADFAASLTQQLLAFSRRQPLFPRVFCVNDSVRHMETMLQRVIGEQIKVCADLRAVIGRVKADATQFEQVLLNLCVNARDAMPGGGQLTIATSDVTYYLDDFYSVNEMPAGEYVKLTVADTGCGIVPEIIKNIFEPFFTTKEKGEGTGLGLATCYGIVKQSGGYISVESTVGVGSSFSIYFPRVEESGEVAARRLEFGLLPGGRETILYVEDEITVRSLTSHILRRLGYTVLEASDGQQTRELLESQNGRGIDLLFADVVLPDLGGKQLAAWVQERSNCTRVLFCSGYIDESVLERHGIDRGSPFLQKPFGPADLARKVREIIDATG
ncbi:MAG: PAS domain S-box protein [Chthoniobacteraceae bacterium]